MAFRPDGILSYDAVKWISRKFSKKQKASAEGGNQ
jgi:branched-chain amino acid transport system permease protein